MVLSCSLPNKLIVYAFEVINVYYIGTVEIVENGEPGPVFSQFPAQFLHLAVGRGGSIYTTEICKCCEPDLAFHCFVDCLDKCKKAIEKNVRKAHSVGCVMSVVVTS